MKDRKMRIDVGLGLEKIITTSIAEAIIRDDMAPAFAQAKYSVGLKIALEKIKRLIESHKDELSPQSSK